MKIKSIVCILIAVSYMVLLPQSVHAEFTEIADSYVKINGEKYWRASAHDARLGAVGDKKTPSSQKNRFFSVKRAPGGLYKVKVEKVWEINSEQHSSLELSASGSTGAAGGSASLDREDEYEARMLIYQMYIGTTNLINKTNLNHKHLESLKDQGSSGRIINTVWILVEGSESSSSCVAGEASFNEATDTFEVGVSGESCRATSVTIPADSVVAYSMLKVKEWDNHALSEPAQCAEGYKVKASKSHVNPKDSCEKIVLSDSGVRCDLNGTHDRSNWFVKKMSGRDVCKSKKGKDDRSVECVNKQDKYVAQSGKDKCTASAVKTKEPFCPAGYEYDKKTKGNGRDMCDLRGIKQLTPDYMEGF